MKVFLQAFFILCTQVTRKHSSSKTKPWKNMIWSHMGTIEAKKKGELTFGLVLALDLGDLPGKSLFFI